MSSLLTAPVSSTLFRLSYPMVFGFLSMMTFQLTDMYFVSLLGVEQASALSFSFPVTMLISSIAIALSAGITTMTARARTEAGEERAAEYTGAGIALALISGLIISLISKVLLNNIVSWTGAESTTHLYVQEYLGVWLSAIPIFYLPMSGSASLRARGIVLFPAIIMGGANLLNILFDYLFIFGHFSFPRLEVAGAAWGTVLSRSISSTIMLTFLLRKKLLLLSLKKLGNLALHIAHIAVPVAASNALSPLTQGWIIKLLAKYGSAPVAAVGIASRMEAFGMMAIIALAGGLSPFLAQNLGAKKIDRVKKALGMSSRFSLLYGTALYLFLLFLGSWFFQFFRQNAEAGEAAILYFTFATLDLPIIGISMTNAVALNAMRLPFLGLGISSLRFLLVIPFSLMFVSLAGIKGLFFSLLPANIIAALISMFVVQHLIRKAANSTRDIAGSTGN